MLSYLISFYAKGGHTSNPSMVQIEQRKAKGDKPTLNMAGVFIPKSTYYPDNFPKISQEYSTVYPTVTSYFLIFPT